MSRYPQTTRATHTNGKASRARRARRPRRDATQWRALIDRQARGRLSVRAFCRQHDLNEASFYDWRRRLGRGRGQVREHGASDVATSGSPTGFVRLEPHGEQRSTSADMLEVRFACGATLRCPGHRLAELVALLNAGHAEAG